MALSQPKREIVSLLLTSIILSSKKLLSDSSEQKFYYKLILWQYLKDKHGLTCAYSTFRAYILKHDEFNRYFMKGYQRLSPKGKTRFETKASHQAQFDWKEGINFKTKDNQMVL
ncbi:hypothetical protein [Staphylococcus aureus]|uniref:hypothetical protein n=1 Tax=Staphylococcus aureus TaxID=1280 RepID=UPI001F46221E|nr:hypothetical protein [Staphylococcus aureus]